MIDVVTVAALVLAWFTFRYERHRRWRSAVDAAYGSLRAVHHAMVQGLIPGQTVGWGQLYFFNGYTDADAEARASQTYASVMQGAIDQVFVVPTEPLATLATATPQEGLITYQTIAVANFALWRVHVFNQLVRQLTDFNAGYVRDVSGGGDDGGREVVAKAAASLSWFVHRHGIGESWVQQDGQRGWYGSLVDAIGSNMSELDTERRAHRRRWFFQWPALIDAVAVAALVAVVADAVS